MTFSWITALNAAEQSAMVVIVLCGGWWSVEKGRRRRTSHLAAVSWERLSSLVFAVSLSITDTASCFSSLFGAGQGVPFQSSSFCAFCSSLLFSFPLCACDRLLSFNPSCLLMTLWALPLSPRRCLFYTAVFFQSSDPQTFSWFS